MAGHGLNTVSSLQCPHGGQVQIQSTNTRSKTQGAPVATFADVYTIVGCPFQIPAVVPIPSPCIQVLWLVPDSRVRVNGSYTLSRSSTGLCIAATGAPQGPVVVVNTQTRAQSQ